MNPTLSDLRAFLSQLDAAPLMLLAVDVETRLGQITDRGFAPSPSFALVVPFIKGFKTNDWSQSEEVEAMALQGHLAEPLPQNLPERPLRHSIHLAHLEVPTQKSASTTPCSATMPSSPRCRRA